MNSVVRVIVSCAALLLLAPHAALAQEVPIPAAPAQPPAAETNAPATPPVAPADLLKPAELDALVAPIALYPDDLLSLVLMASTYPLEVVEAQRWFDANKKMSDGQRKAALEKLAWDQSVKSLIATPTVLEMMSTQLTWTRKLGDAVLAQQADVMDAVQRLRAKARSRDKLVTTKQQRVTVQNTGPRQVIAIEPVDPNLIYVPYYEPAVVYGDWPYVDYPPYFFPYDGYLADGVLAGGLWFGAGYGLGYWGGGSYWGGRCNWGNNNLYYRNGNRWTHRPEHRRGVGYANDRMQRQFGDRRGGGDRLNFRGRDGRQVVNPSANRAAGADRRGAARTGDARGNRSDGARTGQAGRTRSGQRAAQRNGAPNRSVQRQRFQSGRVASRYSNRGRMDVRSGRSGGYAGRGYAGRGGGDFRANSFRGGGGYPGGGRAAFRGGGGYGGGVAIRGGGGFRGGGGAAFGGGGGFRGGGGGGGFRGGGGGGGRGGGGGGHRSDIRLKTDIALVGRLDSGLGLYRFRYRGEPQTYVGVMAQDAQMVRPDAVTRGRDGYLRVRYDKIGFEMQSYETWTARLRHAQTL